MKSKNEFTAYIPELQDMVIGIYCGGGASHSWIWLVDCFESQGFCNLVLLDEGDIHRGDLSKTNIFAMGGGDAFAIAEALWYRGAQALSEFINGGGLYMGFCAGAYLLLDMDEFPLNIFSMTKGRVKNIVEELPPALTLPDKLFTAYGQRYVLHPVREGILLQTLAEDIFEKTELIAPLYGGPPMELTDGEEALAVYQDFTKDTLFVVEEQLARDMMLGTVAVCRKKIGQGWAYLFGPHLENPQYPEANAVLGRIVKKYGHSGSDRVTIDLVSITKISELNVDIIRKIKSHLSNARIVALSMEFSKVTWEIGHKIYEPAKISVFIDAMWRRYNWAAKNEIFAVNDGLVNIGERLEEIVTLLRLIKNYIRENRDTLPLARCMFPLLREVTGNFLKAYFAAKLYAEGRENKCTEGY